MKIYFKNSKLYKEDESLFSDNTFSSITEATIFLISDAEERGYFFVRSENINEWDIYEEAHKEIRPIYSFRCMPLIYAKFKKKCQEKGLSIGSVLENFMKQY